MAFWDWLTKDYEYTGERFGYSKRIFVAIVVFLIIPILLYFLIIKDPIIRIDENGELMKLGVYLVIGLYWAGAYLTYKRHQAKMKLNRLLDKLLDEEEANRLFEAAKKRRRILREEKFSSKKGEKRSEWFGI
ncbi:MAG: hypothetical protein WC808_06585 [Patescibacteria group bacterium]|jgi:predicted nucleotidyltransferase